ncbi:MAG TPA: organomercurial lyase [Pseudonocardiaceae bacterium]|nr:organomercurial lyase [Pseudonocardiaceae bacterium]
MPTTKPTLDQLAAALRAAVPDLEPAEQRLVVGLYRALAKGHPVAPAELADDLTMPIADIDDALDRWPGVYRDNSGNVIGFWGLALSGMPHQLDTGTATITAWCALDPFLIAPMLDTPDLHVRSADPLTGESVTLTITRTGIRDTTPPGAVISMLTPDGPFQADVVQRFCHYVHFFATHDSGQRWSRDHPGTFLLNLEQANTVALNSWPTLVRDALRA